MSWDQRSSPQIFTRHVTKILYFHIFKPMPYGRNHRYGRRMVRRGRQSNYRGRSKWSRKSRGSSYLNTASRALRLAKLAYSMLNVEYKKVDRSSTGTVSSALIATGTLMHIPSQGTLTTQRIGNQIEWKNVFLDGHLTRAPGSTVSATRVRLVIWGIKQNNEADHSLDAFTNVYSATSVNALRNLNHTDDYFILASREYVMTADKPTASVNFSHKFPNNALKYKFNRAATTGNLTDILDKCLYISLTSDDPTPATYTWNTRGTFIDN